MKKLIIALLLCLIPFSVKANEEFIEEFSHHLILQMRASRDMSVRPESVWLNKKNAYASCFMACSNTALNDKLLNKNFCQSVCTNALTTKGNAVIRKAFYHEDTNRFYGKDEFNQFKDFVRNSMHLIGDKNDENFVVTNESYIEYTCDKKCLNFLKRTVNVVAAVFIPAHQYVILSAVLDLSSI